MLFRIISHLCVCVYVCMCVCLFESLSPLFSLFYLPTIYIYIIYLSIYIHSLYACTGEVVFDDFDQYPEQDLVYLARSQATLHAFSRQKERWNVSFGEFLPFFNTEVDVSSSSSSQPHAQSTSGNGIGENHHHHNGGKQTILKNFANQFTLVSEPDGTLYLLSQPADGKKKHNNPEASDIYIISIPNLFHVYIFIFYYCFFIFIYISCANG